MNKSTLEQDDCPIHKIRLETKRGNYKTQVFTTVTPYCPICEETK